MPQNKLLMTFSVNTELPLYIPVTVYTVTSVYASDIITEKMLLLLSRISHA